MNEDQLKQLENQGKVEHVEPAKKTVEELSADVEKRFRDLALGDIDSNDIQIFLQALRTVKKERTTVPTNVPKNFLQQIEFFDNGTEKRLYLYINGAWTKIATNQLLSDAKYMFTDTASDISGYDVMVPLSSYSVGTLVSTPISVTTTPTILHTFASASGLPNIVKIPSGIALAHYETEKNAGSNNYYTYFELYKRSSGGTETLLGTSDQSTETASNRKVQHSISLFLTSDITLLTTDRLVIKIYGVMLSASATINFNYDDNTTARLEYPYYVYS